MHRVRLITAPESEPITLAQAKAHLRVDIDDDDDLITGLIASARSVAEAFLHRALITQTRELVLDYFPYDSLPLLFPPIQSVTSIIYTDTAGVQQTASPAIYQVDVDSEPGRIWPAYGQYWPTVRVLTLNNVRVRYVCGYGNSGEDVPADIRHALLLMIGSMYEHREDIIVGAGASEMPMSANNLLMRHVVHD